MRFGIKGKRVKNQFSGIPVFRKTGKVNIAMFRYENLPAQSLEGIARTGLRFYTGQSQDGEAYDIPPSPPFGHRAT